MSQGCTCSAGAAVTRAPEPRQRPYVELLANIWGTEESLEGMQAFLDKRKPDFQKFRMRSKAELDRYLAGLARDENQAPAG